MRPVAVYSALRLGLFLMCLGLALAFGARGLLAVAIAAAASLTLSFFGLRRQRDQVARALLARRERVQERRSGQPEGQARRATFAEFLRADAAAEDEVADQLAAEHRRGRGRGTA